MSKLTAINIDRQFAQIYPVSEEEQFAWISIQEEYNDDKNLNLPQGPACRGILRLRFSDIEVDTSLFEGKIYNTISDLQAETLVEFIEENIGVNFLVHCFAGISRSGAIAFFLHSYYGYELKTNFWATSSPNRGVLRKLQKAFDKIHKKN